MWVLVPTDSLNDVNPVEPFPNMIRFLKNKNFQDGRLYIVEDHPDDVSILAEITWINIDDESLGDLSEDEKVNEALEKKVKIKEFLEEECK